ncbi:MAG: ADP-ribosylglycohydrolase family protein [Acidobacteria bacterium]|nr:ADP-ribosylglycohydrolase family protein [Acidobacteriota bacterium]
MRLTIEEAIVGCVLGTALGDAIGLPVEGLSRERQFRMYPSLSGHRFFFGRGMFSDDTEHTCAVAEALATSAGDVDLFRKHLATGLRWWLLGLPAGVGFATLRASIRLLVGVSPERSGVFSAGNGPAMRSALLGVCFGSQPSRMCELVLASTLMTHTDPKAVWAAHAVSLAAYQSSSGSVDPEHFQSSLAVALGPDAREFLTLVEEVVASVKLGEDTRRFADSLGLSRGVSGYCFHSVPIALHAWLSFPDSYQSAVLAAIRCGGDTDTTGAITGAIVGAGGGLGKLPPDWLDGLTEWPRTTDWMRALSKCLAESLESGEPRPAPTVPFAAVVLRNAVFTSVVVGHALRRFLPPY